MNIVFLTTQSPTGSTVIGRVSPLAEELAKRHEVTVFVHKGPKAKLNSSFVILNSGNDPFTRTSAGKARLRGIALILRLLANAIIAAGHLLELKPQILIIVKPLPENVLAARLATLFYRPKRIILDVDDFELTANVLTSLSQRAAIHWSERLGAKLADHIVTASPFLSDHFEQLTQSKKPVTLIPTGASIKAEHKKVYNLQTTNYRRHSGIPPGRDNLVYAGSLSVSSGHRVDLLPSILKKVREKYPEVTLHIYGTGDYEKKLSNEFQKMKLEEAVIWHGRFAVDELIQQLPTNTILIDPIDGSISNRAKSSFRVALASVLGIPVITSDIGIRPYLLPQTLHEKFFASPADAAVYAAKVVSLIEQPLSPEQCEQMQKQAQEFDWLRLAQKYETLLTS